MTSQTQYTLHFAQLLTVFFIMLGPLRLAAPFSMSTTFLTVNEKKMLSVKSGFFALIALVLSGLIGARIMKTWNLQPATLLLAVGILFLIAAIHPLIHPTDNTLEPRVEPDPVSIAMKLVISPHGLAAVVVLFSLSHDSTRHLSIIGALTIVIALDILFMAFSKPERKKQQTFVPQILKTLLGTLQFALSLQIIYLGLKHLEVI